MWCVQYVFLWEKSSKGLGCYKGRGHSGKERTVFEVGN